jgi:hypothetical protein
MSTDIETLAEAEASQKSPTTSNTDSLITDIRVRGNEVQCRRGNDWVEVCRLEDVPNTSLGIESDILKADFKQLQETVSRAYDMEKEMWILEYDTHSNGTMKSLYVPLESSFTEDKTVCRIHDDSGDVKEKIKNIDRPITQLETDNLYVDSLTDGTIQSDFEVSYDSRLLTALRNVNFPVGNFVFVQFSFWCILLLFSWASVVFSGYELVQSLLVMSPLAFVVTMTVTTSDEVYSDLITPTTRTTNAFYSSSPTMKEGEAFGHVTFLSVFVFIYRLYKNYRNATGLKNIESTELFEAD